MADRLIFIPPTGPSAVHAVASSLPAKLPYALAETPPAASPLLVVASEPIHFASVRDLVDAGHDVVVWAWRLSEMSAQRFEDYYPVVYGADITAAEVEAAAATAQRPSRSPAAEGGPH